jgi:uridine monophosphate synthetase
MRTTVTSKSSNSNKLKAEWLRDKNQHKAEFCRAMSKVGAIRFVITGIKRRGTAPYFVNLNLLMSFPNEFERAIDILLTIIKTEVDIKKFSRIAGVESKALPYAAVLAHNLGVPLLFVKTGDTKGRERRVEGVLRPGDSVLIVDDVISTGKTAIEAAQKLRSEGVLVEDCVVLLDNERGGKQRLEGNGLRLHAFITIHEVVDYLEDISVITSEERKIVYEWVKKKRAWKQR